MSRTFRRRPSLGKIILLWLEYVFLLLAVVALGYFVWVKADTFVFQSYQSWRLDQMQQGKPASFGRFLRALTPFFQEEPSPEATPRRQARPGRPEQVAPPPSPPRPPLERGDLVGRIRVPRLRLSAVVLEGIDSDTLRRAVGHVPGSSLPGDPGNVDLAGHRDTFFRGLMNVKQGDLITMSTTSGDSYHYRVTSLAILPPTAMQTVNAYNAPGLTLITCYPFYYVGPAPKRYVVHAKELNASANAEKSSAQNAVDAALAARFVSLGLDLDDQQTAADANHADAATVSSASQPESGTRHSGSESSRAPSTPKEARARVASPLRAGPTKAHHWSHSRSRNLSAAPAIAHASSAPESRFPSLDLAAEHSQANQNQAESAPAPPSDSGIGNPESASRLSPTHEPTREASLHTGRRVRARSFAHHRARKSTVARQAVAASSASRSSGLRGFFRKLFKRGNDR